MIFSTDSKIDDQYIYFPEEIIQILSIENNQKIFSYFDAKSRKIIISTIPVSERLHFFRIPFIDKEGIFSKIAGIFEKYHANIEKSDDVSFGPYAVWSVWISFMVKFSDLDEYDDNYSRLVNELNDLIPQHLKESSLNVGEISFNERKAIFTSEPWSKIKQIIKTMKIIKINENNVAKTYARFFLNKKIIKKLKLTEKRVYPIILTLYDEFPFIIVQFIPPDEKLILTKIIIEDVLGSLSECATIVKEYIDLKASDTIIKKSGKSSVWKLYGVLKKGKKYEDYESYLNNIINNGSSKIMKILDIRSLE